MAGKTTYVFLTGIIVCGFIGLMIVTAKYNKAFTEATAAVHHTLVVLDETQQTLSVVLEQDLGRNSSTIEAHIRNLGQFTADNPVQQRRVDSLLSYIRAFANDQAGNAMQHTLVLRGILLRMQGEENRLLASREATNTKSRVLLRNAILTLLIVLFTMLIISTAVIAHNFRRRKEAEKDLTEVEQRFSLLVKHVKDYAIFMIDDEGRIMTWNRGAEQIKGYEPHEVLGRNISMFYTDKDIQQNEPANNLKKAIEAGSFECVGLRKRKDGTVFYADVVFTCMRNDKGEVTGFVKITKDISEQIKVEEEMRLSLIREKELNEMKSRFVTLASHEFKTPLSVILSSISLIEKYSSPDQEDKRARHIHRIKSNVKNLRQILSDFLSLEKLEEGVIRNNPSPVNLIELAEEVITDMEEFCRTDQKINLGVSGQPRIVSMDEHLLRNVLNNLVSNAVKYSPEHTPVSFTVEFHSGTVRFAVSDSGIGIPPEEQAHLFERFFRASNTSGVSGTGLGLSIVKRYLDLMGGNIEVISKPGEGTTFIVTVPATNDPGQTLSGRNEAISHQ